MNKAPSLRHASQRGFTLLEALLIVALLTLLMGVLLPTIQQDQRRSRDMSRAWDLRRVQQALTEYKRNHGSYPSTSGKWFGDAEGFGSFGYDNNGYIPGLVPNYLDALPKDPLEHAPLGKSGYVYKSDGANYKFVLLGTPESFPVGNPFVDPVRTDSWMVSTSDAYTW